MKLGSSALKKTSAEIARRSLYTLIPGGKAQVAPSRVVDLVDTDEGEGGYGWYLCARPDEGGWLAEAAGSSPARTLKLVGSKT
jgi:hypothetical protein